MEEVPTKPQGSKFYVDIFHPMKRYNILDEIRPPPSNIMVGGGNKSAEQPSTSGAMASSVVLDAQSPAKCVADTEMSVVASGYPESTTICYGPSFAVNFERKK